MGHIGGVKFGGGGAEPGVNKRGDDDNMNLAFTGSDKDGCTGSASPCP